MTNLQTALDVEKKSPGKVVLTILLVLVGVGLVLILGVWLGRQLAGPQEPPVDLLPPDPGKPYAVANDYINVRGGPGTNYPIYGVASPGASAEVHGVSPDKAWWAVTIPASLSADERGWVSASYVSTYNIESVPVIEPPPLPPDIDVPPPNPGTAICKTNEPINVRTGPSNKYLSLGKVPRGFLGEVIGVSADHNWWVIVVPAAITPEARGWVSAAYCTGENTSNVPVVEAPPLAEPYSP